MTPAKGEWGGECNRTACRNENAKWFHRSTLKHYCTSCAEQLNHIHQKDARRLFAGTLLIFRSAKNT